MRAIRALGVCCGVGFLLSASGQTNYQRFYAFGPDVSKGSSPRGELIEDAQGVLYGVTYAGGLNDWGTVFRIKKDGSGFQTLHSFESPSLLPVCGVVEGPDGRLYGTIYNGGNNNGGLIYRLDKDGNNYTIVHQFAPSPTDGQSPLARLVLASDGYFYGTAASGGLNNLGVVFRMLPDGSNYSVLYHFDGTNGSNPSAELIEGTDGALYGTAKKGGALDLGTVFRISKTGDFSRLYSFRGTSFGDGSQPLGRLLQIADGTLFGTTYSGGNDDYGTIFRVGTNGSSYTVMWHGAFAATNGYGFVVGLVQDSGGQLFGTVPHGGTLFSGIVYRINTDGSDFTILRSFSASDAGGTEPTSPLLYSADGRLYGSTFSGGVPNQNNVKGVLYKLWPGAANGRVSVSGAASSGVNIGFSEGAAGKLYTIERSDSLSPATWSGIGSMAAGIDGTFTFLDPQGATNRSAFYRAASE